MEKKQKVLFLMSISSSSASHTFILTVYNLNIYSDGPKTICGKVILSIVLTIHSFNKYLFLHYTYRATVDAAGDTQNKWIRLNKLVLMTIISLLVVILHTVFSQPQAFTLKESWQNNYEGFSTNIYCLMKKTILKGFSYRS